MNRTDIQLDRTVRTFADLRLRSLALSTFASLAIGVTSVGLVAFTHLLSRGQFLSPRHWGAHGQWAVMALGFLLLILDPRALTMSDAQYGFLYGTTGWLYAKSIMVMAAAGWIGGRFTLERSFAASALGAIILVALRQMIFERYAFEIALLCFMAVTPLPVANEADGIATPGSPRLFTRLVRIVAVGGISALHLWFGLLTKVSVDDSVASSLLHENALRERRLRPSEIGNAPFPLRGWYLHSYSLVHPLPGGRKLAGFARFSQPTIAAWNEFPSWIAQIYGFRNTSPPADGEIIAETTYSVAWFWKARRGLSRVAPGASADPLGTDFRTVPLPLTNAEWQRLVVGPPIR